MTVGTGNTGAGGAVKLTAGQSTGTSGGDGGAMELTAGESTVDNKAGGDVTVTAGKGSSTTAGRWRRGVDLGWRWRRGGRRRGDGDERRGHGDLLGGRDGCDS